MTIYLFSYSHSPYGNNRSTALKLAEEANWTFINKYSRPSLTGEDILIRYGIYYHPEWDNEVNRVYNRAVSIRLNCCKALAHYILKKHRINVPDIWFLPEKIEKFPVVSRHKYHTKGNDIQFIENKNQLKNRDYRAFYFVEFIPSEIEYRIHILHDKPIRISRKLPMTSRESHPWIRSFSRGWKLRDKTGWEHIPDLEEKAIKECIKALKILNLDFGAIDVVVHKHTMQPYILEINTAPRLNKLGRKKYIKAFKEELK